MGHEPIQLSVSQANHSGLSWLADLRKLQVVSEPKFLNSLLLHTRTSTSGARGHHHHIGSGANKNDKTFKITLEAAGCQQNK